MGRIRTAVRRMGIGGGWTLVTAALLVGYGIDSQDARLLTEFCNGVKQWQAGPDFRRVSCEYVRLSHAAMNATPWGLSVTRLIMGIRSIPGLGPQYAVSPTSQTHYDSFTRGELSAYLHLCGEQTTDWVVRDLHDLATRGATDAEIEHFLRSWKMDRPVASDRAAIAGVRALLVEVGAANVIESRTRLQSDLEWAAINVATRLGYPPDPDRLTSIQEHEVFEQLDADVREHDPELWRSKQISDLCAGIWAQTFGQDYVMVIAPVLNARLVGRIAGPVGIVGLILLNRRRRSAVTSSFGEALEPASR